MWDDRIERKDEKTAAAGETRRKANETARNCDPKKEQKLYIFAADEAPIPS